MSGTIGVVALLVLLTLGVPIGVSMGLVGMVGLVILLGPEPAIIKSGVVLFETVSKYELGVLPPGAEEGLDDGIGVADEAVDQFDLLFVVLLDGRLGDDLPRCVRREGRDGRKKAQKAQKEKREAFGREDGVGTAAGVEGEVFDRDHADPRGVRVLRVQEKVGLAVDQGGVRAVLRNDAARRGDRSKSSV